MVMEEDQVIKLYEKISELSERMARIEGMLESRAYLDDELKTQLIAYDDRIKELENTKAEAGGVWNMVCIGAGVVAFVWEVVSHFIK